MRDSTLTKCAHYARDWPVVSVRSLEPGTHLVSPRRAYAHHGIYAGQGNVVQYGGLVRGLHRGPVEEVSLERFANGRPVWVRYGCQPSFDADEVVRRARSRVGEDRYHLLTNNCEHFCEWCLRAEQRSYQVDGWLDRPHRALQVACEFWALSTRGSAAKSRGNDDEAFRVKFNSSSPVSSTRFGVCVSAGSRQLLRLQHILFHRELRAKNGPTVQPAGGELFAPRPV